jgi:hypothetical protein
MGQVITVGCPYSTLLRNKGHQTYSGSVRAEISILWGPHEPDDGRRR